MSKKKRKRVVLQSNSSEPMPVALSSPEKSEAKEYLKTLRFIRKVDGCKTALYRYVHTANIIRYADEEKAKGFYGILYTQWRTLQRKMVRISRSGIFAPDSLKVATANAVYTALLALYLTNHRDLVANCLHRLLPDLDKMYTPSQVAWSGSMKPVVALTLSLIAGKAMFHLEDFRNERLYEDVKELWNCVYDYNLCTKCTLASPALASSLHGEGIMALGTQELCLAVIDKYEVEGTSEFPHDMPVKVCEIVLKGEE